MYEPGRAWGYTMLARLRERTGTILGWPGRSTMNILEFTPSVSYGRQQ